MTTASDVFKIVTYPFPPGICRVCGVSYGQRDMIDTGLTGDFCNRPHYDPATDSVDSEVDMSLAGAIYFCESCVINMGELVGMLPYGKSDALKKENAMLRDEILKLQQIILGLKEVLSGNDTLRDLISSTRDSFTPSPVSDASDETKTESEIPPTVEADSRIEFHGSVSAESSDGADSRDSEIDESFSVLESGPNSVSTDSSGESGGTGEQSASNTSDSREAKLWF